MTEIEAFIRREASKRGIDPDVAVRIASHEGGLKSWTRQSEVVKNGVREPSFGPFQLYMAGGLGNRALAAGIDPRKESDARAGVQFALDEAARKGWGQWYGRGPAGVGEWEGIGSSAKPVGVTLTSNPVVAAAGPKYTAPIGPTPSGVPMPSELANPTAVAEAPPPATWAESLKQDVSTPDGVLAGIASGMANQRQQAAEAQAAASQIVPTGNNLGPDTAQFAAAQQLMATLLQRRRGRVPGLTLPGGFA